MSNQLIEWSSVKSWIAKNPSKSKKLTLKQSTVESLPYQESNEWTTSAVVPATPLSCTLFLQDSIYPSLQVEKRESVLREECTKLQEQSITQCKGRQFPVRKTAEGLVQVSLETRGDYCPIGLKAMTFLRECQIICLNEQTKHLTFVPEDVRLWSNEKEVLIMQSDFRGVYHPPTSFKPTNILEWISNKESSGWVIEYPVAEVTLSVEELKKILTTNNQSIIPKQTKDAMRKRAGRSQSINLLKSWE
jgi:hypothetical protein